MPIRDLLVTAIVLGALPFALKHAYIGVLLWTWISIMNPHRLAWGFAYTFVVCQGLMPGSFSGPGAAESPRTWVELLFFSMMVLSSVGLSDIMPATPMARSLVMLEAFAGVMYVTLVVSRLIGLVVSERQQHS